MDEYKRYIENWQPERLVVTDTIEWWQQHEMEYPILSKMAYDIFSIPSMSAECERVFSQALRLLIDDRNALAPETVEALLIQQHGLRTGLFTAGKEG